jgi:hypothetical protein
MVRERERRVREGCGRELWGADACPYVAVPAAATAELYSVASEPSAFLPVMRAESVASSKEVQ